MARSRPKLKTHQIPFAVLSNNEAYYLLPIAEGHESDSQSEHKPETSELSRVEVSGFAPESSNSLAEIAFDDDDAYFRELDNSPSDDENEALPSRGFQTPGPDSSPAPDAEDVSESLGNPTTYPHFFATRSAQPTQTIVSRPRLSLCPAQDNS